jgi:hypothetical protein
MKKCVGLFLITILLVSGCSNSKPITAEDFKIFYSGVSNVVSTAELESRRNLSYDEFWKTFKGDYDLYSQKLNEIASYFFELSNRLGDSESKAFSNAGKILDSLNNDFKSESRVLAGTVCVDATATLEEALICTDQQFRWASSTSRALQCSFYRASLEFEEFSSFDKKRVSELDELSEKELSSCDLFENSSSLYGFPKRIIVTKIPDRFQSKFLDQDNDFPVEIAEGLYTEYTGDLLTDSLYGSWHGKCAVYSRYEQLLRENGFLLGSIKNGSCS